MFNPKQVQERIDALRAAIKAERDPLRMQEHVAELQATLSERAEIFTRRIEVLTVWLVVLTVVLSILTVALVVKEFSHAPQAASLPPEIVAEPKPQPPATPQCEVNLKKAGQMEDVLSNVLIRAEHKPESEVAAFLKDAVRRYATGDDLLKAAAEHFKIDQKRLAPLVEHWRHINCKHAAIPGYAVPDAGREATTGETMSPVPVSVFAAEEATPQVPPYRSSVVGTDFDFITESDPNTFDRLEDKGQGPAEMPDKSDRSAPLVQEAFLFVAHFNDGTRVQLAIDADFKTQDSARQEALRHTPRLGKLPTALRRGVERVVIHKGGENVTAFGGDGAIILYADNATKRIGTHDLEETVFHESVHAAWDKTHAKSAEWQDAQKKDGGYVTDYARKKPQGEDLAESALFAYALLHHPDRLPKEEAARIARIIPNRIAFVEKLLPKDKPLHFPVEAKR